MDRNTITGLLLIGAILIGYSLWMQPSDAEQAEAQRIQDSIANAQIADEIFDESNTAIREDSTVAASMGAELDSTEVALRDSLAQLERKRRLGTFANAGDGTPEYHTIENEFVRLTLSNQGAAPVSAELIEYVTFDSMPLLRVRRKRLAARFKTEKVDTLVPPIALKIIHR